MASTDPDHQVQSALLMVDAADLTEALRDVPPSCEMLAVTLRDGVFADESQQVLEDHCRDRQHIKKLKVSFPAAHRTSSEVSLRPKFFAFNNHLVELDLSQLGPLRSIGDWALCGCSKLEALTLPVTESGVLTRIGAHVLQATPKLRTLLNMPWASTAAIGGYFLYSSGIGSLDVDLASLKALATIAACTTSAFRATEHVDLSGLSSLTSVGDEFLNGLGLRSVNLSGLSSLTTIGDDFLQCSSVEQIDLSGLTAVTSIGSDFMFKAHNVKNIDFSSLIALTSVGSSFLAGCSGLEGVNLSGFTSVTTIGPGFIAQCSSMKALDIAPLCDSLDLACLGDDFLGVGFCRTAASDKLEVTFGTPHRAPPPRKAAVWATLIGLVRPLLEYPNPCRTVSRELQRMERDDDVRGLLAHGSHDSDIFADDLRTGAFAFVKALVRSEYNRHALCSRDHNSDASVSDSVEVNTEGLRQQVLDVCGELRALVTGDAGFAKYAAKCAHLKELVRSKDTENERLYARLDEVVREIADVKQQLADATRTPGQKTPRAGVGQSSSDQQPTGRMQPRAMH